MIPPFEDSGYLPPGIHRATLAEIEERSGQSSELRRAQMASIRWMVDLARQASVQRIVLNGSFVTDIMDPNDVDCVLLVSDQLAGDPEADEALDNGLPFLDISLVEAAEFDYFVNRFFAADRRSHSKGMVEVIL